jgi:hypothetical protein
MSPIVSWPELAAELKQMRESDAYKPLRALLDTAEALIGAGPTLGNQEVPLTTAKGLLHNIRFLHEKSSVGEDLNKLVDGVAMGFIQPHLAVTGTLNQANGDLVNNIIVNIFGEKREALEQETPSPALLVPIVLVVMTAAEAKDLADGPAFDQYAQPDALRNDFKPLQSLLENNGMAKWFLCYRATPQAWRPNGIQGGPTIADLVKDALDQVHVAGLSERPLRADFKDIREINRSENRPILKNLRERGCIVILDSISIRHPLLLREYHHSMLDAYPCTSVVRLVPLANAFDLVRNMKIAFQWSFSEMEFDRRRTDPFDEYSCMDISDFSEFPKWFLNQVKKLLPSATGPQAGILREMKRI